MMRLTKTMLLAAGMGLSACTFNNQQPALSSVNSPSDEFAQAKTILTQANIDTCVRMMKTDVPSLQSPENRYRDLMPTAIGTSLNLVCTYYASTSSGEGPFSPALIKLSPVGARLWVVSSYQGTVLSVPHMDGTPDGLLQLKQSKILGKKRDELAAIGQDLTSPQRQDVVSFLNAAQNSSAINEKLGL
jgi:hypothetical protein